MPDEKSMLEELISSIKQQRDELAVQVHLGKAEAKKEWSKIEDRLSALAKEYEPVKDVVDETSAEVVSGLKLIADEILEGFKRVRKLL